MLKQCLILILVAIMFDEVMGEKLTDMMLGYLWASVIAFIIGDFILEIGLRRYFDKSIDKG